MNEVKWSLTSQTIIIRMELIRSFINDSTENAEDLDDSFVRIQRFHCFKDVEQWLVLLVQTKIDRFKHFIQYKVHQLLLVTLIVAVARLIFYCVIWVENTDNIVFHDSLGLQWNLMGHFSIYCQWSSITLRPQPLATSGIWERLILLKNSEKATKEHTIMNTNEHHIITKGTCLSNLC